MQNKQDKTKGKQEQIKQTKEKRELFATILNGVILVLIVAVLLQTVVLVRLLWREVRGYTYKESTFLYDVEYGQYDRMLEKMYTNESFGVKPTKTMEECYAVARYFEAASYEIACRQDGQIERADQYLKIMEEQEEKMGDFYYVIEDIHKKLKKEKRLDRGEFPFCPIFLYGS